MRSAPGIKEYLTACHAIDQDYTTLAYPATICMDCQAAEITDDESSVQTPEKSDVDQMREEIFKAKEPVPMIQDEDTTVEEDSPTYSQDTQEYMHWHYRLNHPTHTVMIKMAKQNMLPRRITKILVDMNITLNPEKVVKTRVCVDTGADMTICSHTFLTQRFGENSLET